MSEVKPKEGNNSGGKPRYQGKGKDGRPPRGPPLSPAQQRRRAAEERISNSFIFTSIIPVFNSLF